MHNKFLLLLLTLILALPANAVNCDKKPCHRKCIATQPEYIQTKCKCKKRKKVYYHLFANPGTGVPEYNEACDGSFEEYRIKYCEAKRYYDNAYLSNPNYAYTYTPRYDELCEGSYEDYSQRVQQLKHNQAINNMADALRKPQQVNVNHSGNVNHNVNLDGTVRIRNYYYGY